MPKRSAATRSRTSKSKDRTWDAVIVGGGIMGCGSAFELARNGVRVLVLERSVPGAEASSAAAGILGAQVESHAQGALFELALRSRALYPEWAQSLAAKTGIDVELRSSGVVRVAFDPKAQAHVVREHAFQAKHGCRVETWNRTDLHERLPAVSGDANAAVYFPDDARIDPPKLLRALHIAAEREGAVFRSGALVKRVVTSGKRVEGVALDDGSVVRAGRVIVAAGSWSSLVEGVPLPSGGVIPARGQIVELCLPLPLFEPVIFGPKCYLVPRDDGRVLIGSTLEFVGYRREVTAVAVRDLLDAAIRLVPSLGEATLGRTWSNFRPYTQDSQPVIGEAGIEGLLLATGHYRNGILLAPITAAIVSALVLGKEPPIAPDAWSPLRRSGTRREKPRKAKRSPR
ncbi:MAG: glycine oxidase ThiO [Myxococcota bacterium]